jgi:putative DNA primase/helicase
MLDLRDLVHQHGGDLYAGGRAAVIPGPGHSRQDRSLSLRLSEDGERVIFHSFANDPPRDVMAYLGMEARHSDSRSNKEEWARQKRLREAEARRQEAADLVLCKRIWAETSPIAGTAAEAYLWSRDLVLDGVDDVRFHPAAPRSKDPANILTHPAMVALVRSLDGEPRALHLTSIEADGSGKAFGARARLMFGPVGGHAVHLAGGGSGRVLAVGEGIETTAAYSALKGLAGWATLSTSGMSKLRVPWGLRKLVIASDGDRGGAKAAQELAERACKFCDVEIDPAPDGQDWADVWSARNG